jgi:hypothetical protein
MFITDHKKIPFPDPGSRISDLGPNNEKGVEKIHCCLILFVDINLDKNDNYYIEQLH